MFAELDEVIENVSPLLRATSKGRPLTVLPPEPTPCEAIEDVTLLSVTL